MSYSPALADLVAAYEADALLRYVEESAGRGGASPPQAEFHRAQQRKRLVRAANKVGKTYAGAAEAWWHLLGAHPYRTTPPPGSLGWILVPDLTSSWPSVSAVLRQLEPPGALDPSCRYVDGEGYFYRQRKGIRLCARLRGGAAVAKGCDQKTLALESARVAWAWGDEPPKRGHFEALRARLSMDVGPYWWTLTPIGRPCGWLRAIVDGDPEAGTGPEEADWWQRVAALSHENAPHRTPESIAAQLADTPAYERGQRILAEWEGFSVGRRVPGFDEGCLFEESDLPAAGVQSIGLGWDHGETPGAQVCYLVGWDGRTLWVLGEATSPERSTTTEDAARAIALLGEWGLGIDNVEEARGDSNSAGKLGVGLKVNDVLEREFARLAKRARPPFRIALPYKAPGSVRYRARLISAACSEGRFRVHSSCRRLQHSLRHWMGEEGELKHPFDGISYIAEPYLSRGLGLGAAKMRLVG